MTLCSLEEKKYICLNYTYGETFSLWTFTLRSNMGQYLGIQHGGGLSKTSTQRFFFLPVSRQTAATAAVKWAAAAAATSSMRLESDELPVLPSLSCAPYSPPPSTSPGDNLLAHLLKGNPADQYLSSFAWYLSLSVRCHWRPPLPRSSRWGKRQDVPPLLTERIHSYQLQHLLIHYR